jgi:eukaryotic-like serine/threonine-protein kinase
VLVDPGFLRLRTASGKYRVHEIHHATTESGDLEFLTMEFLEGETLRDRLARDKRLSLQDTALIARQLCAGLNEAHLKGIIHGDLKPTNVMLTEASAGQLRAVITDFGLARPVPTRELPPVGSPLLGVPAYVAPELLKGGSRSIASDLFALGVILCEMLGGDKLPPNAPRHWKRVIQRCLELDPGARPQSAQAVLAGLEGRWSPQRVRHPS